MDKLDKQKFLNKALGAYFGLAIGDALGVETEGKSFTEIKQKYGYLEDFISENPSGSDDTEFAVFNTILLQKYGLNITSNDIVKEWIKNLVSNDVPMKGAGFSEMMTVENLRKGLLPPLSGMHLHGWSDGLAMRVLPFGIIAKGNADLAKKLTVTDGMVSHTCEGIESAVAVAAAVTKALITDDLDQIFKCALDIVDKDSWTHYNITRAIQIGNEADNIQTCIEKLNREIVAGYYHWSDLAPEAVGLSFGILAFTKANFKNAVLAGVNIGRDTDTIAAICGAICGAIIGYNKIPNEWKTRIQKLRGICIQSLNGIDIKDCVINFVEAVY